MLKKLNIDEIKLMLGRALKISNLTRQEAGLPVVEVDDDAMDYVAGLADGDGRSALNIFEIMIGVANKPSEDALNKADDSSTPVRVSKALVSSVLKRTHMVYDKLGDGHYDAISALHKSVRGSDPDAALLYLGRMLKSGEDPLYIARRMVRMASEDIGLADDTCLPFAVSTYQSVQQIGMPEADCILAHCAVKLALAPKSVMVYRAYNKVKAMLDQEPGLAASEIPIHLRNAPTKLMKSLGYGKEYKYNPDYVDGKVEQEYMPSGYEGLKFLGNRHLGPEDSL